MSSTGGSAAAPASSGTNLPSPLLDALNQAKLHIDNALNSAGMAPGSQATLARGLRAMDPTNTGCSNCSCGGGGGGGSGCNMRAQETSLAPDLAGARATP